MAFLMEQQTEIATALTLGCSKGTKAVMGSRVVLEGLQATEMMEGELSVVQQGKAKMEKA